MVDCANETCNSYLSWFDDLTEFEVMTDIVVEATENQYCMSVKSHESQLLVRSVPCNSQFELICEVDCSGPNPVEGKLLFY